MNGKILTSLLLIGLVIVLVGGTTFAYFHDEETSAGNTFTASTLDLTVSSHNDPLPIWFNLTSLAPGRSGSTYRVIRNIGTTNGTLDISNVTVVNTGGAHPEPERAVDPLNNGSLGANMNVTLELNGAPGNILIYSGTLNGMAGHYDLNYSLLAIYPHAPLNWNTAYLVLTWHIPTTVGNIIQGDTAMVNLTITLNQTI